ncbi:hypothetical protein Asp14428_45970 [Actinoplanes sp. NBRC 14428]|uniref:Uncharacterized protein n=1 Tax=Pseudosporangium ferrugineum TaxID=439699 RepID=A0A2T0S0X3_9ACTN|nr:hypothetical protein [Pseudosporangium ferrugineum]PRY27076.1 hypothetical protein CLV70_11139 [Pseudosporangium ferrugineum]BCJ53122.1 hypothetical protein Asp14428_45970 [Actinoplanes sp. NBRC 14428]
MTYPSNDHDLETPEVDAAEQAVEAAPGWLDESREDVEAPTAIEVSEWDAQEQSRIVEMEDDYR